MVATASSNTPASTAIAAARSGTWVFEPVPGMADPTAKLDWAVSVHAAPAFDEATTTWVPVVAGAMVVSVAFPLLSATAEPTGTPSTEKVTVVPGQKPCAVKVMLLPGVGEESSTVTMGADGG